MLRSPGIPRLSHPRPRFRSRLRPRPRPPPRCRRPPREAGEDLSLHTAQVRPHALEVVQSRLLGQGQVVLVEPGDARDGVVLEAAEERVRDRPEEPEVRLVALVADGAILAEVPAHDDTHVPHGGNGKVRDLGVLVELRQLLAVRHEHLGVHAEVINPPLQEAKRCKAQTFNAHVIIKA